MVGSRHWSDGGMVSIPFLPFHSAPALRRALASLASWPAGAAAVDGAGAAYRPGLRTWRAAMLLAATGFLPAALLRLSGDWLGFCHRVASSPVPPWGARHRPAGRDQAPHRHRRDRGASMRPRGGRPCSAAMGYGRRAFAGLAGRYRATAAAGRAQHAPKRPAWPNAMSFLAVRRAAGADRSCVPCCCCGARVTSIDRSDSVPSGHSFHSSTRGDQGQTVILIHPSGSVR